MTRLKNLEEMYLKRCHFITVIHRRSFGSFCIYKYFTGFDGVWERKQNKALGSQSTPKASLCVSKGAWPQGAPPFREPGWESCSKPAFLKGAADRRVSILWPPPTAAANRVCEPASARVTAPWDKAHPFSFPELLAENGAQVACVLAVPLQPEATFQHSP